MKPGALFLLSALFLVSAPARGAEAEPPPARAKTEQVINFSLLDYRGRYHELQRADARVVVLFFTGNGCPIARQSVSKIRALRSKFTAQGAVFWMINSYAHDERAEVAAEAEEFRIGSIPVLLDDLQGVARSLGVRRTAETIAIDTRDWSILYRGAVDDQFTEGAKKPKATKTYLETALKEFFAGQPVTEPKTMTSGCLIKFEAEKLNDGGEISYPRQIAPILAAKCVHCHSPGNIAPFSMSNHKKVSGWSDMIQEVLLEKRMPPWHADPHVGKFSNDRSLTLDESRLILRWIEQGAPRGDGEDPLPAAIEREPKGDWQLGPPDQIVSLPAPQTVPPTGVLGYRYVDSPFEMPHDAWVRAAVMRPGNRKVLHHVIVRVRYPAGSAGRPEDEVFFTSWAPGNNNPACPEGTGKFLPKGSRFNFELHYTTNGREETDQSELGLYFLAEPPKLVFETRTTESRDLLIPPGQAEARAHAVTCLKRETLLYDFAPHMHLRGSTFTYEALYPDGRRETLLSVPNYDFNWQNEYRLAQPKRLPAGTWILCTGSHDNSPKNPRNPDPAKAVKWGLQSFEEMFMGFITVAEVAPEKPAAKPAQSAGTEK